MDGPSLRRIVEEEAEDCCIASIAAANASHIHRAMVGSVRRDVVEYSLE
jgi:hypothetical protein